MRKEEWMRKAFSLAKKGIGKIVNEPLNSLLLVQGDETLFFWNHDGKHRLDEAIDHHSIKQGGVLYLPYEPEMNPKLLLWILNSSVISIEISQLNRIEPNRFVEWAKANKIEVNVGLLKDEGFNLNEIYFHRLTSPYPFITLSFGMSLDGKIATYTGDSKYISGNESLAFVHQLRHEHQAILVGINTVLIDHPKLTTRLEKIKGRDPIKIILDSTLKINLDEPLFTSSKAKTIIVTKKDTCPEKKNTLIKMGVKIIEVEDKSSPMNIKEILLKLRNEGIESLLVEGGGTIHFSFVKERLFNRIYATVSPMIIGGESAKTAVSGQGFKTLKEAAKLKFTQVNLYGKDYIIEAVLDEENSEEKK